MSTDVKSLRDALNTADWAALMPQLLGYTSWHLRTSGRARKLMTPEQAISDAVTACYEGRRNWDASRVDLCGLLCGVVRSLISNACKHAARRETKSTDAADDFECVAMAALDAALWRDTPEALVMQAEGALAALDVVAKCAGDDPDLCAFVDAVLDGSAKRVRLTDSLAWTPERVSAARIKLQRRLKKRYGSDPFELAS